MKQQLIDEWFIQSCKECVDWDSFLIARIEGLSAMILSLHERNEDLRIEFMLKLAESKLNPSFDNNDWTERV